MEWGDVVQRYNKFNIIAARDHGKSYYFSNAYLIWKLYRYQPFISKQVSRKDLALSKKGYLFFVGLSFSIVFICHLLHSATKPLLLDNYKYKKLCVKQLALSDNNIIQKVLVSQEKRLSYSFYCFLSYWIS